MREHMLIAHTLIRADLLCRVLLIGYPKSQSVTKWSGSQLMFDDSRLRGKANTRL